MKALARMEEEEEVGPEKERVLSGKFFIKIRSKPLYLIVAWIKRF